MSSSRVDGITEAYICGINLQQNRLWMCGIWVSNKVSVIRPGCYSGSSPESLPGSNTNSPSVCFPGGKGRNATVVMKETVDGQLLGKSEGSYRQSSDQRATSRLLGEDKTTKKLAFDGEGMI